MKEEIDLNQEQDAPKFVGQDAQNYNPEVAFSILENMTSLNSWEIVELPSRGIYYEGWENGIVEVKPMTQKVERALVHERQIASGEAFNVMFTNCVRLPGGMSPDDLLSGDRNFLFYYLRGITYGHEYKFSHTCAVCGHVSVLEYDLTQSYSEDSVVFGDPSIGPEPFKVELPHLSEAMEQDVWVEVRWLRGRDTNIRNMRTIRNKGGVKAAHVRRNSLNQSREDLRGKPNPEEIYNDVGLKRMIVSFMGERDPMAIETLVDNLHPRDVRAIRDFTIKYCPGIDLSIQIECGECGNSVTRLLPITESFLR